MTNDLTEDDLRGALDNVFDRIRTEMRIRFAEVTTRLDRMDATLAEHGKQLASYQRAIAGCNEWMAKTDADYTHVLAELAQLRTRVEKLERKIP
jgi:hypothetical protein